jgi:[ribosomal protein S5]-alanine N-acetyltransferase
MKVPTGQEGKCMSTVTSFSSLPAMETERLLLRKITMADMADIYEYGSDPLVSRYVGWPTHESMEDTQEFASHIIQQYEKESIGFWGIELKENRKLIGTIDFVSWQPKHKTAEIGYVISPDYWGKGYTSEAVKKVFSFGFIDMDLVRIQARCFLENIGSQRVMEKAGMTFEGVVRKGLYMKGKHQDLKLYSILKEEYSQEI